MYIPTTPNPTGGYMLLVRKSRIQPLDMSVDQALKYIISMGVAAPPNGSYEFKARQLLWCQTIEIDRVSRARAQQN